VTEGIFWTEGIRSDETKIDYFLPLFDKNRPLIKKQ